MTIEEAIDLGNESVSKSTDIELSMYKVGMIDKGKTVNRKTIYLSTYNNSLKSIKKYTDDGYSIDDISISNEQIDCLISNVKEISFNLFKKTYEI